MGKKRVSVLGSENEDALKAKRSVQKEQKKIREGKSVVKEETGASEVNKVNEVNSVVESESSTSKSRKAHIRSKAYKTAKAQVKLETLYTIDEALALLKKISLTSFDPTVELHLVLQEKGLNKEVEMPHSTGKVKKIGIADAGFLKNLEENKADLNLDVLLTTPDMMPKLAKHAKVLGPKGLMPNPKNGTVVADPAKTLKELNTKNNLTLKTEKDAPLVHTIAGKLSYKEAQLKANITAILTAVQGKVVKAFIKTTMSPSLKLAI